MHLRKYIVGFMEAHSAAMTEIGLKSIRDSLAKIEKGLKQRYEKLVGIGDVERLVEKAPTALNVVEEIYKESPNGASSDFNAEVHVDALRSSHDELIDTCIEVNKEFA